MEALQLLEEELRLRLRLARMSLLTVVYVERLTAANTTLAHNAAARLVTVVWAHRGVMPTRTRSTTETGAQLRLLRLLPVHVQSWLQQEANVARPTAARTALAHNAAARLATAVWAHRGATQIRIRSTTAEGAPLRFY